MSFRRHLVCGHGAVAISILSTEAPMISQLAGLRSINNLVRFNGRLVR